MSAAPVRSSRRSLGGCLRELLLKAPGQIILSLPFDPISAAPFPSGSFLFSERAQIHQFAHLEIADGRWMDAVATIVGLLH